MTLVLLYLVVLVLVGVVLFAVGSLLFGRGEVLPPLPRGRGLPRAAKRLCPGAFSSERLHASRPLRPRKALTVPCRLTMS